MVAPITGIDAVTTADGTTKNGVKYLELLGSKTVSYGMESSSGVRRFRVNWDDRKNFLDSIFGTAGDLPTPWGSDVGVKVFDGDFPRLIATSAEVEPSFNDDQGATKTIASRYYGGLDYEISYTFADITVNYETRSDDTLQIEFSSESYTIDKAKYKFADGNTPPNNISINMPTIDVIVKFYHHTLIKRGLSIPWSTILSAIGKVNDDTVLFSSVSDIATSLSFPQYTLKLESAEMTPTMYYESNDFLYQYHFRYRRGRWDAMFREDKEGSDRFGVITSVTGAYSPYDSVDVTTIIPYEIANVGYIHGYDEWI